MILRNDCNKDEGKLLFELNNSCTPIDYLNDEIRRNAKCCASLNYYINDLYHQLIDMENVIKLLVNNNNQPCYNLCVTPNTKKVLALKPIYTNKRLQKRSIIKHTDCKLVTIETRKLYFPKHCKNVPIIGVGCFKADCDRLVDNNGKDLSDYLPVHFGHDIGDIVLMGVIGYKYLGGGYGRESDNYKYSLFYEIYDKRTTVTKVYEGSIYHWVKYTK